MLLGVRNDADVDLSSADGDYTPLAPDSKGRLRVTGTVTASGAAAHDSPSSGNPTQIAGEARTAEPTAVSTGDVVRLLADKTGKLVVLHGCLPEDSLSGVTAAITNTADTQLVAAQGAGVRAYLKTIVISNSHATVDTVVEVKDGTTVKARLYAAADGGGGAWIFDPPLRGTANTAWNVANLTNGSSTYVSCSGYKGV